MDDNEIGALKAAHKINRVFFQPDPDSDGDRNPVRVTRIGPGAKTERTSVEPDQCAWFTDGDCISLRDVLLSQFSMHSAISAESPKYAAGEALLSTSFERFWLSRRTAQAGDLDKVAERADAIEYRNDHVQRHWWTYHNAVRQHGAGDALYQWLRSQNWTAGTLCVVNTEDVPMGTLSVSSYRLDEAIRGHMTREALTPAAEAS